ncbi:Oidioi.mRNA.OKI2018_I69.chr2.g5285.t1.cds [Oikopleura dioica]|uniref:Oidioi.mRNA.OKI2018_I69.chr2.g5285.t1.cds n=1 Tax=Oikopleura dioica TaxID=34765 RepID=A0ABN7T918_OIKDI|nr:Oidioi.mRNA.OKI2018_I69.chr2.g5285.t1.cds [Oikopleura dioica]
MTERETISKKILENIEHKKILRQKIWFQFNGILHESNVGVIFHGGLSIAAKIIEENLVGKNVTVIGGFTTLSYQIQVACFLAKIRFIALDSEEQERFDFIDLIESEAVFLDETSIRSDFSLTLKNMIPVYRFGEKYPHLRMNITNSSESKKITFHGSFSTSDFEKVKEVVDSTSSSDVACFSTTSGSTGRPKIIQYANRMTFNPVFENDPKGVSGAVGLVKRFGRDFRYFLGEVAGALFINFVTHMTHGLICQFLRNEGRNILLADNNDITNSLAAMKKLNCITAVMYLPKCLEIMESEAFRKIKPDSLLILLITGTKVHPEHCQRIKSKFEQVLHRSPVILKGYGSTECSGFFVRHGILTSEEVQFKTDGKFTISKEYELRIVDENNNDVRQGKIGEIIVKTPDLMLGYKNHPKQEGWYRMGDEGFLDEFGNLNIVGRVKEQIILKSTKKSNCSLLEEKILLSGCPIKEAVVLNRRNSDGYDDIIAILVCENFQAADIISKITSLLAAEIKDTPKVFCQEKSFPKLASGKYDRRALFNKYFL